ncbi:MAG: acyl-CoA synthetase [Burkholderiaceae bacterium]
MAGMIISGERRQSADQRLENSARAASALHALGVRADDCVALYLRNDFAFFEASAACALLGAYATPINWHYTAEEAGYILRDCDARAVIIHADLLPAVAAVIPDGVPVLVVPTPPEIARAYRLPPTGSLPESAMQWADAIAAAAAWTAPAPAARSTMIYTSGTTGHPKGVRRQPMTAGAMARRGQIAFEGFGLPPDGSSVRAVMTGPMYHSAPNHYALSAANSGAVIVLQPRFDAEELLAMIEQHRITHMHMVPTMFVRLLRLPRAVRERYDLGSLVHVVHGAAPCPADTKRQMIEWWGPVIHEYYGSTENGIVTVTTSQMALDKPGTVGKPICGNQIRILDDDKRDLPPGQLGEIYIGVPDRTDFTYYKRDAARREMDVEGFLTNGDMGWLDEDGCLFLADRKNDMVISGGVNIYPAEIEKVLIGYPGIRDCAVFGIPDEEFGEALAAHIQPGEGYELDEVAIRQWLAGHVAKYKIPRVVVFEDALPREDSGKIFKRKLREPYWAGRARRI